DIVCQAGRASDTVLLWRAWVGDVPDVDPAGVRIVAVVDRVDDRRVRANEQVVRPAGVEFADDLRRFRCPFGEPVIDDLDAGVAGRVVAPTVQHLLWADLA